MKPNELLETLASCQEPIQFATTPARAFTMVSLLQLAIRHPDLPPYPAQVASEMISHLSEAIATVTGQPAIAELIAMGNSAEWDVTEEEADQLFDTDILGKTPDESA